MWIFLPDAFLSVVKHREKPDIMLVRSRKAVDIRVTFPAALVEHTPAADYPYRAEVDRRVVAARLAEHVLHTLDYDNFKAVIPFDDPTRYNCYSSVWATMIQMEAPRREPAPYLVRPAQYNSHKKKKNKRNRARKTL